MLKSLLYDGYNIMYGFVLISYLVYNPNTPTEELSGFKDGGTPKCVKDQNVTVAYHLDMNRLHLDMKRLHI